MYLLYAFDIIIPATFLFFYIQLALYMHFMLYSW